MYDYSFYNKPKHKVFISFYHHDDQKFKNYIDTYLCSNIINKSVAYGEYDSEDSDSYIKRLIREEKISDSSVVVVLVGPNTRKRKHVDWEIYAGLRGSINGNSGLIGILLPDFPLTNEGKYYYSDLPDRLADNVKSGYADIYVWDYAKSHFDSLIEDAFNNKIARKRKTDNARLQMQYNR